MDKALPNIEKLDADPGLNRPATEVDISEEAIETEGPRITDLADGGAEVDFDPSQVNPGNPDDFLPDIRVEKNGDDYLVYGKNEYGQDWTVSYEGPRWLEIEPGQKPVYFKGEFEIADVWPRQVGVDDFDMEQELIKGVDEILGGNARSMEEFATGNKIEGLTKGEKQVDWAEGKFQQSLDEWQEEQAGVFDEVN